MMIIDGRSLAKTIRDEVAKDVASLPSPPGLGVLLVGDDPASDIYVRLKEKAAADAGIRTDIRRLPGTVADTELEHIIRAWNADRQIHAILVQLPLPPGHNADRIVSAIDPKKDADGFHPANIRALEAGEGTIVPPVHEAILRLIASTGMDPRHKSATIIANSDTFAKPLDHILQKAGFITARLHPDELDMDVTKTSDVLVVAVGRKGFLGADLVKDGAIIIDVGTNRCEDGNVYGDADRANLEKLEGWITPVPGGVGPMTVALLLKNVVRMAGAEGRT
ncbi:bifunctional 5,10-methylenetetrahydrofolate dehydrogenase/5,10-methenyltetrahydrofolate cyclohydrolase [Patescibacteria group bacterium]|uniref:Bifunctional protein FolD n=1 Tax=candidate division WWE3 bacterium TaxID=2053526 RepID=A0A928TW29_UNCKA|nr:bifunctional 5,10-methylenetetrahydrofolate dehydrogenase/5,10-methenyltetrahydrofolate cyclohydrolase [candidate division WWE3 bacterium]MCL4732181.1 bifunctional 5,10-methylenetetrahydrofolate dehydrogenase/5,10-methenyltetrahydrofolate cyclohydrolase [Patescibacteria group bacterium]MDL1953486.1 bifunctional 5,10-methylenetetrahydrofolate dehydrogenase/5,10-methenyltetrahydrofolate cyclohydrolase [Candidatus Uhrbacteria bacterium UHB]RIL00464.1 MAG: bifunctional methylenetetrahydrofolate d